jgi:amidohydrolase
MINTLINLRKQLHQHPELSGQEVMTAMRVTNFLQDHGGKILTGVGGNGVAGVWDFASPGPTIVVRAELDALPIQEVNVFSHRSLHQGVSHKCGHDGHMTIVAGLSPWLKNQHFDRGKVVLLFQPAEETGKGGRAVSEDSQFQQLKPDYIFALHNIPGFPLHTILTTPTYFSATVESVVFHLHGKQSHASEPEKGINPASAIAELVNGFASLNVKDILDHDFALLTPVHLHLGQIAYGISAGEAEAHYTLRTWSEDTMALLKNKISDIVSDVAHRHQLTFSAEWFDYFPASINDDRCTQIIKQAAEHNDFAVHALPHAFKFGEDFGWYSKKYRSAMFGIGAGEHSPALHYADYDFPDSIIETGVRMFQAMINDILING